MAINDKRFVVGGRERQLYYFDWDINLLDLKYLDNAVGRAVHASYTGDGQQLAVGQGIEARLLQIERRSANAPYFLLDRYYYPSSLLLRSIYSLPETDKIIAVGFDSPCVEVFDPVSADIEYVIPCGSVGDNSFEFEPGYLRTSAGGSGFDGIVANDYILGKSGSSSALYSTGEQRDLYVFDDTVIIQRVTFIQQKVSSATTHKVAVDFDIELLRDADRITLRTEVPVLRVRVYNASGQLIIEHANVARSGDLTYTTEAFAKGAYFVDVTATSGTRKVLPFVKI